MWTTMGYSSTAHAQEETTVTAIGVGRTYQRIRTHFHWRGLFKKCATMRGTMHGL
ncbi:hypothetical protein L914_13614 [Phytophthora nicotianae]|uniref:Integrase zinc-binding domain-containing protein n=1 Tax=Phytophthora nicotianae TaxID=4792 RepID=W2MVP8_PHYNI|nr:hypothetical protein L914_13614 [Phytophthora nicotianae]